MISANGMIYLNPDEQIMYENYLAHHGIKGQKWGHRRFQAEDGSLTSQGRQRYGVLERTKIRLRGAGQEIRSVSKNVRNAKGFGNKASELIGYGRMRTHQENKSRVQDKLAKASRTRLGKAIHKQKSANAGHIASYAESMKKAPLAKKFFENVVYPSEILNTKYTRLSGRETTVGKQFLDNYFTLGLYGAAKDVSYMSAKKKSAKANA